MKAMVKFNGFARECGTADDLKQLKRKLSELNNGEEIRIALKLNREQGNGVSKIGHGFAENLVEGLKWV